MMVVMRLMMLMVYLVEWWVWAAIWTWQWWRWCWWCTWLSGECGLPAEHDNDDDNVDGVPGWVLSVGCQLNMTMMTMMLMVYLVEWWVWAASWTWQWWRLCWWCTWLSVECGLPAEHDYDDDDVDGVPGWVVSVGCQLNMTMMTTMLMVAPRMKTGTRPTNLIRYPKLYPNRKMSDPWRFGRFLIIFQRYKMALLSVFV
jgi:hypothetical protein